MSTQDEGKTAEQLAADEAAAAAAADGGTGKTEAELQAEQAATEEAARVAAEAEAAAAAAAAETPEAKAAKAEGERAKRFSDLTRREQAALRRAEEAERVAALALDALQRTGGGEKKTAEAKKEDPKPVAPKFADLNDPDKFAEAMTDYTEKLTEWTARRVVETRFAEQDQTASKARQQDEIARIENEYAGHRQKALAELPDFVEIAENPDLQVTPSMAAAMKSSGAMAPRLLYHLGQNPEEAARIAKLSPGAQFMAIGELKATLASQAKAQPKPLPKPIVPTGQARSTTKSVDDMPMEEYAAHRNAQIKAQRAGGAR